MSVDRAILLAFPRIWAIDEIWIELCEGSCQIEPDRLARAMLLHDPSDTPQTVFSRLLEAGELRAAAGLLDRPGLLEIDGDDRWMERRLQEAGAANLETVRSRITLLEGRARRVGAWSPVCAEAARSALDLAPHRTVAAERVLVELEDTISETEQDSLRRVERALDERCRSINDAPLRDAYADIVRQAASNGEIDQAFGLLAREAVQVAVEVVIPAMRWVPPELDLKRLLREITATEAGAVAPTFQPFVPPADDQTAWRIVQVLHDYMEQGAWRSDTAALFAVTLGARLGAASSEFQCDSGGGSFIVHSVSGFADPLFKVMTGGDSILIALPTAKVVTADDLQSDRPVLLVTTDQGPAVPDGIVPLSLRQVLAFVAQPPREGLLRRLLGPWVPDRRAVLLRHWRPDEPLRVRVAESCACVGVRFENATLLDRLLFLSGYEVELSQLLLEVLFVRHATHRPPRRLTLGAEDIDEAGLDARFVARVQARLEPPALSKADRLVFALFRYILIDLSLRETGVTVADMETAASAFDLVLPIAQGLGRLCAASLLEEVSGHWFPARNGLWRLLDRQLPWPEEDFYLHMG